MSLASGRASASIERADLRCVQAQRLARGFTLVELLVVVSIIALLISILLPSLRSARDQAKLTKCVAHMRGIGQSSMTFAVDHEGYVQLVAAEPGVEEVDPARTRYAYGSGGELLSWPVALAQAAGVRYRNNWDWGVRAAKFRDAIAKEDQITEDFELMVCPGDKIRLSSPFYPRNEGTNRGLKGNGDPANPEPPSAQNLAYWGRLSYGINEDITGEDGDTGLCWRSAVIGDRAVECTGGTNYSPIHPCSLGGGGNRLQGQIDKVFDPATAGLVFETGPESEEQYLSMQAYDEFANLLITYLTESPFLGDVQQEYPSRIPNNRHREGRVSVLYTDAHGGAVRPIRYADDNFRNKLLPAEYAPRVRVSPFQYREAR